MTKPKKLVSLSIAAVGGIQASTTSRTLAGELVRYGVLGRTSVGRLRVRPGALRFPDDLARVKLTREHKRDESRGYCTGVEKYDGGIRASVKVSDGPEGDAALREAADGTRDAFSFDVVDATVVGDEITDALVIAIGQVGIPAYDDSRIDTIAAAAANPTGRNIMLSPEQAQRLLELQARIDNGETLSEDEQKEYDALKVLSALQHAGSTDGADSPAEGVTASAATPAGGVHVHLHNGSPEPEKKEIAASAPTPPAGAPGPGSSSTSAAPQGGAFGKLCTDLAEAFKSDNKVAAITAALNDLTYSSQVDNIQQPAWSGELWSGLEYAAEFDGIFVEAPMTSLKGLGWRFVTKIAMADYAGDKAAIPTTTVTTETSDWTGARQAVGLDIDRAFFDFPTPGFIESLFQQARESWAINMDAKKKAYILAKAAAAAVDENAGVPVAIGAQPTLLKAVGVAIRALKRRRVGKADWVLVSDEDMFTLLDTEVTQVLAYLKLFNIDPEQLRSTSQLAAGTVYAGVKPAAKFRQFPGSPIRVDAQHLANGGVDEAFFGYWALEEQHKRGIAKATFTPA